MRIGIVGVLLGVASAVAGQRTEPLRCDLSGYEAGEGLTATLGDDGLSLTWDGGPGEEARVRFGIDAGVPTLRELAIRPTGGPWQELGRDLRPEYRIVSGRRRVTQQQLDPLEALGTPITDSLVGALQWDAFWDAPLYVDEAEAMTHGSSLPPAEPFAGQPGMPRQQGEITRAEATYAATACTVRTAPGRLEVTFPGATAGPFAGYLEFVVYRGTSLLRQSLVARTREPSVAFKYDAGLAGLPAGDSAAVVWRDLTRQPQRYRFGGPPHRAPVTVRGANRLVAADLPAGALAAFPPPHRFFWARETEENLGYGYYRADSAGAFALGVRQAELEDNPMFLQNFALYNARPGTWQRMPVFYLLSPGGAEDAIAGALDFTHGDAYPAVPGYKVMGHHYHVGAVERLDAAGGLDARLNDVTTARGIGMDIYSVVDGARGPGRKDTGELFLADLHRYYDMARRQSDRGFLLAPNDENSTGGRRPFLGGHYDLLLSHPVYWRPARPAGAPLHAPHPTYGTVYNVGAPADLVAMAEAEDILISMPHPAAKRSTGYPAAILDSAYFRHPAYWGLGYRWGMGIDASETRLGEYRFLRLWDATNNHLARAGGALKQALAISEARSDKGARGKPPTDDAYAMSPVNYVRTDSVPGVDDMRAITSSLRSGDYFVTTGEVLMPAFDVRRAGDTATVVAELAWTFPLDFVEVVWGDGEAVGREIVPAGGEGPFGKTTFEVPVAVAGKRWLRFAGWDVAGNGVLSPVVGL